MKQTIYFQDDVRGRVVSLGQIEDGTFTKTVTEQHYMKVNQSYAIQEEGFQALIKAGCKTIIIFRKDLNKKYTSNIETWKQYGRVANYGYGKQRFLSVPFLEGSVVKEKPKKVIEQVPLF